MELFNYSLIRAVPDPRRGEWVNVGVCVYLAGFLDVRLSESNTKLRALDPNLDTRSLRDLSRHWNEIAEGFPTTAEKQLALGSLPFVHASGVAQFIAENKDYEEQLGLILRDLVIPPVAIREKREARLQATLKTHLRRAKLYSDDPNAIREHKVVSNFPIKEQAGLYADFAARNGVMHITETIDFRVKSEQLRNRHGLAAIKSITLDVAFGIFPNCNRNVVYAYHPRDIDAIQPSLNMLRDYSMHMFDAGAPNELAQFVEVTAQALSQMH
jgi:hypothetical protein